MIIVNRKELVDEVENSLEQVESYQNDMPKVDWAKLHYTFEAHLENLSRLSTAVNALVKAVNAPEPEPTFAPFPVANTTADEAEAKRRRDLEPRGAPHIPGEAHKHAHVANTSANTAPRKVARASKED